MSRLHLAAYLVLGIIIGGLGMALVSRESGPRTDVPAVQAIVADALARHDAAQEPTVAGIDQKTINSMVENYLMSDPQVLERASAELDRQNRAAAAERTAKAIAANSTAIFNAPNEIVVGNPEGDVTLVEMFDYNCTFCRGALPDLVQLIAEDRNLRVVLKEFPILGQGSVDAARVAVAVSRSKANYWTFHQALFESRGAVTGQTALAEAKALGLDPEKIESEAKAPDVDAVIQKSYDLANTLGVTGTPTYIIGDEIIPGAVDIGQLRSRIDNMRKCGKTSCESVPS